jgi:hypothetical protein
VVALAGGVGGVVGFLVWAWMDAGRRVDNLSRYHVPMQRYAAAVNELNWPTVAELEAERRANRVGGYGRIWEFPT